MSTQVVESTPFSHVFWGACKDTSTAWRQTSISKMLKVEQVESMRKAMLEGTADSISEFFVHMAQNPYSNLAWSSGFDDAKALKLAGWMMSAYLEPFVHKRAPGALLDLLGVRDSMREWIDFGKLPQGALEGSDIGKITNLVSGPEQRVVLSACFAAPIQFSMLALSFEDPQ